MRDSSSIGKLRNMHGIIADTIAQQLIETLFSNWNKQELGALMELFSEDIELISNKVMDLLPEANGRIKGSKTLRTYWGALMQLYPHYRFLLKRFQVEENRIVVYYMTDDRQTHCISKLHLNSAGLIERMEVVYI